jgi:hypothetical protein
MYAGQAAASPFLIEQATRQDSVSRSSLYELQHTNIAYDISYLRCKHTLPDYDPMRSVVGVNGGYTNNFNKCFPREFQWAQGLRLYENQPNVNLYIWAASPGPKFEGAVVKDWPKTGTNAYGVCRGTDSAACSYQLGLNDCSTDLAYVRQQLGVARIGVVFINVEFAGGWQTNALNDLLAIEGYATSIEDTGATAGIYLDQTQFIDITGSAAVESLDSLPEWIAGAGTIQDAKEDCAMPFLTGGQPVLSQYRLGPYPSGKLSPVDLNYVCPA